MSKWTTLSVAVLLVSGTLPAAAQAPYRSRFEHWRPDSTPRNTGRLVMGGVVGTGVAVGAGILVYQLAGGGTVCGDDPCGLVGGLLMAIVVQPVLVPLGVHLANHRRGNFAATMLASTAAAGAVILLGSQFDLDGDLLLAVPALQIGVSVLAERATSH